MLIMYTDSYLNQLKRIKQDLIANMELTFNLILIHIINISLVIMLNFKTLNGIH